MANIYRETATSNLGCGQPRATYPYGRTKPRPIFRIDFSCVLKIFYRACPETSLVLDGAESWSDREADSGSE
jgi:hypothetical protein